MRLDIEDFKKKFEPMIIQSMASGKIPGGAYTIFQNEEIIYSRGFGCRNLQTNAPYTPDTLNNYGSIAKSFTALGILLLQEEGKLSIENPISKYLPITIGKENRPITIKHLLSHSSGIPNLGVGESDLARLDLEWDYPLTPLSSWDDYFTMVNNASTELLYDPGEHFYYLNTGFFLLGRILELVSGLSYPVFMKEKIFSKLGLDRTSFSISDIGHDTNHSTRYYYRPDSNGPPVPNVIFEPADRFDYGPTGPVSSTNQMARYVMMLMNNGSLDGNQLFDPSIINELTTGRIKTYIFNEFGESKYCYGWFRVENFLGDTLLLHPGGGPLGCAVMVYLQNAKIGIISSNNFIRSANDTIFALCYLLNKKPEEEFSYFKRNRHLRKLAGDYRTFMGIHTTKIVFEGGCLYREVDNSKERYQLIPQSDTLDEVNFYIQTSTGKLDLEFTIDKDNKIYYAFGISLYHKI